MRMNGDGLLEPMSRSGAAAPSVAHKVTTSPDLLCVVLEDSGSISWVGSLRDIKRRGGGGLLPFLLFLFSPHAPPPPDPPDPPDPPTLHRPAS